MMNLAWDHARAAHQAPALARLAACGAPAEVLRPDAARQALQALAPAGVTWQQAELANVWYTPPQRLLLVYHLQAPGRAPQTACLAFGPEPAQDAGQDSAARRPPPRTLAAWCAWAWCVPEDPGGLPLARLLDPAYSAEQLGRRHDSTALDSPVADAEGATCTNDLRGPGAPAPARLLSYLPGARLAALWPDLGVVMKHQAGMARSHALLQALWLHPERRFGMPEPLALDPLADVRWEAFVPGGRLESLALARGASGWTETLADLAAPLAALHALPVDTLPAALADSLPRVEADGVMARLEGKVRRRLVHSLPGQAAALDTACEALHHWMPPPTPRPVLLHGDLHTGNFLVRTLPTDRSAHGETGTAISFIDLDSLSTGHAGFDLALLSTRLVLQALLGQADARAVAQALRRWPAQHAEAHGSSEAAQDYPWMVAALLLARQLKTCIRHFAPDLERLAEALIALSRTISAQRSLEGDFTSTLLTHCARLATGRDEADGAADRRPMPPPGAAPDAVPQGTASLPEALLP